MSAYSRFVLMLLAAALVARPALACCLTSGPTPDAPPTLSAELPPCHGGDATPLPTTIEDAASDDCGACGDCDSALLHASAEDTDPALAQSQGETPAATSVAPPALYRAGLASLKTGPPAHASPPRPTPISLKQRLLI